VDNQTRIGIGASSLFAGIGVLYLMVPLSLWTTAPLMAFCAGVAIWGFWPLCAGYLGHFFGPYIPLRDAAWLAYRKLSGTSHAVDAERESAGDPTRIRQRFAANIRAQVPIYGRRSRGEALFKVPQSAWLYGKFIDGGATLELSSGETPYRDLCVKRTDLPAYFEKVRRLLED